MPTKPFDPISLLEDAYRPTGDPARWLTENARRIIGPIDVDGVGAVSYFVRDSGDMLTNAAYQPGTIALDQEAALASLQARIAALTPEQADHARLVMQQPGAHGLLDTFGPIDGTRIALRRDDSFADIPAVVIPTGEHVVALVATYVEATPSFSRDERRLWERISIHLGAACRLSARADGPEAGDVEAVLDTAGRVVDARDAATAADARALLRESVRGLDRARTRSGRADRASALELWRALYGGRWSLVEHVDTDARRFVLARRNDPDRIAPLALTHRQRQVLFYASVGWSFKQIAYALGLMSEGSVSSHLASALNKLGLSSRVELIRVTSQWAAAIAASRAAPADSEHELTAAEREVAQQVIDGCSNQQIAARRGVSVRTVANQLARVYRKLGLQDRHDLVRWLSSREISE